MQTSSEELKECPVCHARCFADMDVCYGCLHSFAHDETQIPVVIPNDDQNVMNNQGSLEDQDIVNNQSLINDGGSANWRNLGSADLGSASQNSSGRTFTGRDFMNQNATSQSYANLDSNQKTVVLPVQQDQGDTYSQTQTVYTDLFEIVISVRALKPTN